MARMYSNPNPYYKTLSRRFDRRVIILILVALAAAAAYMVSDNNSIFAGLFGVFLVGIIIILAKSFFQSIDRNEQGRDGESEIKKILIALPESYAVFHNIPLPQNGDADLVVVGPTGIFALEVKSHRFVNLFQSIKFTRQAKREAMALKNFLTNNGFHIYVDAVLVLSRAFMKYKPQKRGIYVINKESLLAYIQNRRPINYNQSRIEEAIHKLYN